MCPFVYLLQSTKHVYQTIDDVLGGDDKENIATKGVPSKNKQQQSPRLKFTELQYKTLQVNIIRLATFLYINDQF